MIPAEHRSYEGPLEKAYLRRHYPWLYPLVYPRGVATRDIVISKWTKPVRISLGLPSDLKPYDAPLYMGKPITEHPDWPVVLDEKKALVWKEYRPFHYPYANVNSDAVRIAMEEALRWAPVFTQLTGLPVSFVADEPRRDARQVSNLRIVLAPSKEVEWWTTKFKRGPVHRLNDFPSSVEGSIPNAVFFTPVMGESQVEGLYVTNPEKEIEFAVCYIRDDHDPTLLRLLIRECLVRSFGFSDNHASWRLPSLLSFWNYTYKDFKGRLRDHALQQVKSIDDIPARDREFIKLLYSEKLRAGMHYRDVFEKLYRSGNVPSQK
ncbi:hypothetical protein [Sinorhizobium medicae]|uniref:hypothetical protein n=1 Tax=Sinorhizobium medicae TaxID=110321 RepID=UPI002B1BDEDD|nr:hypothetical protein [Sinorhizobium medicae]WQO45902.1 hypothetical protein U8C42_02430 [Sinorhizobium medicae]